MRLEISRIPTDLGVFNINAGTLTGGIACIIPSITPPGSCYKVEIIRVSPPPSFTGTAQCVLRGRSVREPDHYAAACGDVWPGYPVRAQRD